MSPVIVSGITSQTPPLLSTGKSNTSAQDGIATGTPPASPARESKPSPADTISISSQLLQTINEVKKELATKVETVKENSSEKSTVVMSKVQFAYDMKGDLSVRYMDASNNIIYQTPSELMIRMKEEADSRLNSAVNTKA